MVPDTEEQWSLFPRESTEMLARSESHRAGLRGSTSIRVRRDCLCRNDLSVNIQKGYRKPQNQDLISFEIDLGYNRHTSLMVLRTSVHTGPSGTGTCWCRVSRGTFHLLCCSPLHSSNVTVPITVLPWPWSLMTLAQWTLGMRTHSSSVGPWLAIPFNAVEHHVVSIVNKKNNSCCSQKHWQLSQLPDASGCPPGPSKTGCTQFMNENQESPEGIPGRPWAIM